MKTNNILKVILISFALISSFKLWANDLDNESDVEQKIEQLQKSIDLLPKLSGYLQSGWNYTSNDEKSTSSFQAKRLRLLLDGNVAHNISFRLQVEAFNGIAGSTNGNGQKTVQVMDAFATWKIKSEFQLRAGQFYTPMGFENYNISPATLETVDFSNICYRMACRNAIDYNFTDYGRDLGILAFGNLFPSGEGYNHVSYDIALTNGSLPTKDDSNTSKDFISALTVRPIKHMMIKGAYNWGEYANENGKFQPMNRTIVGAWYNNPSGLNMRAELGKVKSNSTTKVDETSAYILLGWHVKNWLPVVRWDMYKDDQNETSVNNYNRILAGATYQVTTNFKLQANYNYKMYSDKAKEAIGFDSDHQVQIMGLFRF